MAKAKTEGPRMFRATITGTGSLLMHNGQLANPRNQWAKAIKLISSKRKKADEDYEEMARLEFLGGLYYDDEIGPYIPAECIDGALTDGAKKKKLGKAFKSCVMAEGEKFALDYKGPRDRNKLWESGQFQHECLAVVGMARVVRTRPRFRDWGVTFDIALIPGEVNPSDIEEALRVSGAYGGLCDYRPKYGRFTVESFKEV
jgi:hypothetical protein